MLGRFEVVDMPVKIPPIDFDELYRRYQAGESTHDLARGVGFGQTTIVRHFRARGFALRPSGREAKSPGLDRLRSLYVDQQLSSEQMGPLLHVSPAVVRQWLRAAGLSRTPSDAHRLRNERLSPEVRQANSAAAHDAVRGSHRTFEDLCRRAQGVELRQSNVSPLDRQLLEWVPSGQICKAVGPYNVDVAVGSIAVEIFGGGWHGGGRAAERWPERVRYLLDEGWSVVVIWVDPVRYPLHIKAADYVVALDEVARGAPALGSQYRVIRGAGEEVVLGCFQDDHFPVKAPRKGRAQVRCDHLRIPD